MPGCLLFHIKCVPGELQHSFPCDSGPKETWPKDWYLMGLSATASQGCSHSLNYQKVHHTCFKHVIDKQVPVKHTTTTLVRAHVAVRLCKYPPFSFPTDFLCPQMALHLQITHCVVFASTSCMEQGRRSCERNVKSKSGPRLLVWKANQNSGQN